MDVFNRTETLLALFPQAADYVIVEQFLKAYSWDAIMFYYLLLGDEGSLVPFRDFVLKKAKEFDETRKVVEK